MLNLARESSLKRYAEPGVAGNPLMTEVALISTHRRISQGELARRYAEASGGHVTSRNVKAHFETKRLTLKVALVYAKILAMGDRYVDLFLEPVRSAMSLSYEGPDWSSIDQYLKPRTVEPLFDDGAISEAVRLLRADPQLRMECFWTAELELCRSRAMRRPYWDREPGFPLVLMMSLDEDRKELLEKWLTVGSILKPRFDLLSRISKKRPSLLDQEDILLRVWKILHLTGVTWHEWLAVENVLSAFFYEKRMPVIEMLKRLHGDEHWPDFEKYQSLKNKLSGTLPAEV